MTETGVVGSAKDRKKTVREKQRDQARLILKKQPFSQSGSVGIIEDDRQLGLQRHIVSSIVVGQDALFSQAFLVKHKQLLTSRWKSSVMFVNETHGELLYQLQIHSRWGWGKVDWIRERLRKFQSNFTLIELAVWIGRYVCLQRLLVGGCNPAVRGRVESGERNEELEAAGVCFLHLARQMNAPYTLQAYAVKRVTELREKWVAPCYVLSKDGGSLFILCDACEKQCSLGLAMTFDNAECQHKFCESCMWKDLSECLFDFYLEDLVACPVCHRRVVVRANEGKSSMCRSNASMSPIERRNQSLQRYLALPADGRALKRLKARKPKIKDVDALACSWSVSVRSIVGRSQEVRRDRFLDKVENDCFPTVRGCLQMGVDVDISNEYGQTALMIAIRKGSSRIVRLLLEYGSNPHWMDNSGISVWHIARSRGNDEIIGLLLDASATPSDAYICQDPKWLDAFRKFSHSSCKPRPAVLIEPCSPHPGAGSYLIDECLSNDLVSGLIELYDSLPLAEKTKDKKEGLAPSSVRRYFCDSLKVLCSLLGKVISSVGTSNEANAVVLPHMRFLCYEEPGSLLNSHVDLCRINEETGERSSHTLILYLTDCDQGGATILQKELSAESEVSCRVKPTRARLLLFPHNCPHSGEIVVSVPKLLIRGEVCLPGDYKIAAKPSI